MTTRCSTCLRPRAQPEDRDALGGMSLDETAAFCWSDDCDAGPTIDAMRAELARVTAAAREFFDARSALDNARCAYLVACRASKWNEIKDGGRAITEATARRDAAEAALRELVKT